MLYTIFIYFLLFNILFGNSFVLSFVLFYFYSSSCLKFILYFCICFIIFYFFLFNQVLVWKLFCLEIISLFIFCSIKNHFYQLKFFYLLSHCAQFQIFVVGIDFAYSYSSGAHGVLPLHQLSTGTCLVWTLRRLRGEIPRWGTQP